MARPRALDFDTMTSLMKHLYTIGEYDAAEYIADLYGQLDKLRAGNRRRKAAHQARTRKLKCVQVQAKDLVGYPER
jgi:hypothetical protein